MSTEQDVSHSRPGTEPIPPDARADELYLCNTRIVWSRGGSCSVGVVVMQEDPRRIAAEHCFVAITRIVWPPGRTIPPDARADELYLCTRGILSGPDGPCPEGVVVPIDDPRRLASPECFGVLTSRVG